MSVDIGELSATNYLDTERYRISTKSLSASLSIHRFVGACILADFVILALSIVCVHPIIEGRFGSLSINAGAVILSGMIFSLTCQHGKLYDIRRLRDGLRCFAPLLARWVVLWAVLLAIMTILGAADRAECYQMLLCSVSGLASLCLMRITLGLAIRYRICKGAFIHSIGVIGDNATADAIVNALGSSGRGIHISRVFPKNKISGESTADDAMLELFGTHNIDSVIVAAPITTFGGINGLLQALRRHPVNIYATPASLQLHGISSTWLRRTGFPELSLVPLVNCPSNGAELLVKSAVDRLFACILVVFFGPLMLLCALGILLSDPGPIFFRQKRVGYKGQEFSILKFRTMYRVPNPSFALTCRNDPRIFLFGGFLRKTSLDELPQILNVLRGEMSLVGPRPHMAEATAAGIPYFEAVDEYAARHRVKPGMTGWAQVNGFRGPTETLEQIRCRVTHDIHYIENWSLALDFTILCRTAMVVIGKNVF